MTIASTDLLAPVGELEPALYPLDTVAGLQQRLEEWLLLGYTNATAAGITDPLKQDAVAEAFACMRWYQGALQRIIGSPTTSALVDKESHSYSSKQLELLQAELERWRLKYAAALVVDVPVIEQLGEPSGTQTATFRW